MRSCREIFLWHLVVIPVANPVAIPVHGKTVQEELRQHWAHATEAPLETVAASPEALGALSATRAAHTHVDSCVALSLTRSRQSLLDTAVEIFRWLLSLISRILVRA